MNKLRLASFAVLGALVTSVSQAAEDPTEITARDYGIDPVGVSGKYVYRDGSKSKFLEDHNVQSGVDAFLGYEEILDDSAFRLQGFGQSGERQGFVIGEYSQNGLFGLVLDLGHWTEYYNNRNGGSRPTLFPRTNDSTFFYGDGIPSTDWLSAGGAVDVQIGKFVHDVYADFHYRQVDGDQTLLKGGGVDGVADASGTVFPIPPNADTGPINFGFTGRKDLEYDAYLASAGLRSDVLGINWQTDVGFQYHDINSSTQEVSYDTAQSGGTLAAVDTFTEDTHLKIWKADIAGSHHVNHSLYLFGAGFFSYERSDPEPDQDVFENITARSLRTRTTTSSKVERYTPGGSLGLIWRPASKVVVRADARVRGHIQEADLTESRDETQLLTLTAGDISQLTHSADRDSVVETTNLGVDWKPMPRLTIRGNARYQYRYDDVDTRQDTTLIGDRPEIEEYVQESHRIKVGPTARYRMRRGRSVEGGYEFTYADVEQDIDNLANQYNLGDYEEFKHRVFAKASGRIVDKLRGELRATYQFATREMDGALGADALGNILIPSSSATAQMWSWQVAPVMYWTPHEKWTLHGRYTIGQYSLEADSAGSFEYEVFTHSLNAGVGFRASDTWSVSGDYTFYLNDDDVENDGHNASLTGRVRVMDNLSVNGGVRYLGYNADSSPDDYDAVVVSAGVTGKF